jgi:hypothetical protein
MAWKKLILQENLRQDPLHTTRGIMHRPWKRKRAAVIIVGDADAVASLENTSCSGVSNMASIISPRPVVTPDAGVEGAWSAGDIVMALIYPQAGGAAREEMS